MGERDRQRGASVAPSYERPRSREGIRYRDSLEIIDDPIIYKQLQHLKAVCGITEDSRIEGHIKSVLQMRARGDGNNSSVTHLEIYNNVHKKETSFTESKRPVSWLSSLLKMFSSKVNGNEKDEESIAKEERQVFTASSWRLTPMDSVERLCENPKKEDKDEVYNFDTLYRQVILKVIDLIGEIPASESHHHNWKQGLLQHSLEVGIIALKQAKSSDLKAIGMNDLEQSRRVRYQYAAFIVGLLHDIGKAITDMVIHCDTDSSGPIRNKLVRWNPIINDLHQFMQKGNYKRYFIDMNPASKYIERSSRFTRHEKLAATLLSRVLTPESQHYLSSAPDVGFGLYEKVTAILSGNKHADRYLSNALSTGERISTHLSFSKTLSTIHLNDRNTSIADLLISELAACREDEPVMNQIVMIGGNAVMKYPQILDILVKRIEQKSPGTTLGGYTFDELANMLVDHNYIFRSQSGKATLYFTPIKAKSVKKKIEWVDDGDGFPVLMLTDPTLAFGSQVPPKGVSGKLDMPGGKQLEYRGENEVKFDLEKNDTPETRLTIEEQFEREVVTTYEALFNRTEKEYAARKSEQALASETSSCDDDSSKEVGANDGVPEDTDTSVEDKNSISNSDGGNEGAVSKASGSESEDPTPSGNFDMDCPPPPTEQELADYESMNASYEDGAYEPIYSNNDSVQQQLNRSRKGEVKSKKNKDVDINELPAVKGSNLSMSDLDTETTVKPSRKKNSTMRKELSNGVDKIDADNKKEQRSAVAKTGESVEVPLEDGQAIEKPDDGKVPESVEVPLKDGQGLEKPDVGKVPESVEVPLKDGQGLEKPDVGKVPESVKKPSVEIEVNPDLEAESYSDHNLTSEWQYKLLFQLINQIKKGKLFPVDEEITQEMFNREVIKFISTSTTSNKQNPYHVVAVLTIIWEKVSRNGVFVLKTKRSST